MMSSAETLNFGPQWLRDLAEGSSTSPTSPPTVQIAPATKFKLAENRYGREELLALFVEDSEIPEELQRAPSLVSEVVQVPLAFRPSNEHSRASLPTSFRGRGAVSSGLGLRGRSIPSRGRGRGRGSTWADHDDGPLRRPPLVRRSESEGWRNDSLRGKGDGAEDIMGGLKEWRTAGGGGGGGQRPDFWKDTRRDRQGDANEPRYARGRSLSSRDADDSDRRWQEDGFDEAAANSKQPDFMEELPDCGNEPTKSNDIGGGDKVPSKDGETSDSPPTTGVTTNGLSTGNTEKLPNSSSCDTVPERPLKSLEPVPEAKETPETGQGGGTRQNQPPPNEEGIDPILQTNINPLEDMFQKLSANDSGDVPERGQLFQEVQMSEPHLTLFNDQVLQTRPFSSNSLIGDIPATTNSPIAKLQALATTWFYKDPQGDVQGPFSSVQMMEWFSAGYFTTVLLVKRACDTEFIPLGELIKRWGHIPFTSPSPPKSSFPNSASAVSASGSASLLMQQKFTEQQQNQMQYVKLLQEQNQQQRQLHQQPPLHPQLHQQQMKPQPPPIGRSYQQQANIELILAKLSKSQDFLRLSPQHQQHVVLQYAEELKRQSMVPDVSRGVPIQPAVANDSLNVLNTHPNEPIQPPLDVLFQQQHSLLEEARKEEEKEVRRIQKQQEEQNEIMRKHEEEFRRKKEMLAREEEQIKRLQLEAQRKAEVLQRKIVEDERLKKMREIEEMERRRLLEEEERRRQQEEHERRNVELRKIQEEEERKRKEEERRSLEEEEARRLEEQKQEELRRLELEREEQRKLEEIRRKEEYERQLAKEVEMQRKAETIRIQKEKKAEAQALLKKQQQEKQMRQMQLPSHAKWGHNQPPSSQNDSLSLSEIQDIEKQEEQLKLREEARMVRENRNQVPKPKTGWGATDQGAHGMSLLDIQREEAKQMSFTKQVAKPEEVPTLNFNTSWNKPPKIQPDVPKPQTSFWDQVVEENPKKSSPPRLIQNQKQQQKKQTKQQPKGAKQKVKSDEGQQIKALFQQQITKDSFTDWCESYLRNMTVGSIDIPTFINFLRDVESPYEVQEYVQSYLGESKEAKDFTTLFLEQRAKLGGYEYKPSSTNFDREPQTSTARDKDGFEVVTSNTKRGKKKLRKLQKVDPSILGFSVNASSDRVNMGEIQTTND